MRANATTNLRSMAELYWKFCSKVSLLWSALERPSLRVIDRAFVAGDRPVGLIIPCPIIWVSHDANDQART